MDSSIPAHLSCLKISKLSNTSAAFFTFGLIHRMYEAVVIPRTFIRSVNCSRNVKLTVALAKPLAEQPEYGRRTIDGEGVERRLVDVME